ncbi:thermostable hemolysin [Phycobacter sp. K97]|uniref:thermostable hemolysin n=1 Tax=Phycobacter sedimenti TaxID=3133977 RepID=UPI00311F1F0B
MRIEFLTATHPDRVRAEDHVRQVYAQTYGASISSFPPLLAAAFNAKGDTLCAAGIRTAKDGFFSDCYLDSDFPTALLIHTGLSIDESQIMEVTSLASTSPFPVLSVLSSIIEWGRERGMICGVFTATGPLRRLLRRTGLSHTPLFAADPSRLTNPQIWGSYYTTAPWVCAVLDSTDNQARVARKPRPAPERRAF